METSLMRAADAVWPVNEQDLAERVRLLLREEKYWVQHTFSQYHRRCLVGAAEDAGAYAPQWVVDGFLDRCAQVIREQYPERYHVEPGTHSGYSVACFNDHEDTTYPDIRTVIEKVIAG
jgi:hypothetical protein